MSSADAFMFDLFKLYSRALKTDQRGSYFVLSSGTNEFPAPRMYKKLWQQEIESDLFYRYYTFEEGYPPVVSSLKLCENTIATGRVGGPQPLEHLCVTQGASSAVAGLFDWLGRERPDRRLLLLGLNYSLFARCASTYNWQVDELLSANPSRILPSVDEVKASGLHPTLVVLTLPGNPSGEVYDENELRELLRWARERETFVLIDKVALDEFMAPRGKWVNIGRAVVEEEAVSYTAIVGSLSKTRSLPGVRFGYLTGPKAAVDHVKETARVTVMNPSVQLVLPVAMDALLRTLVILEHEGRTEAWGPAITLFRRMFLVTNAMDDERGEQLKALWTREAVDSTYREFFGELSENFDAIEQNRLTALEVLRPYLEAASRLGSGFNMAIRLSPLARIDQAEVCRRAFASKGLALFPEACFRCSPATEENFWVRLSLAAPPASFKRQVSLLREHLDELAGGGDGNG